jgi:polysaccharide pyruvyl transferase WcaK-like protein
MTRVAVFYGHAASNWGDLAINSGLVEMLQSLDVDVEQSFAVRLNPSDKYSEPSRESLQSMALLDAPLDGASKSASRELMQLNDYVSALDGFIRDFKLRSLDFIIINSGEHFFESATQENFRDLLWRALPVMASNRARTPVVVMPSTMGPFRTPFGETLMNLLKRLPVDMAFRETMSPEIVGQEPSEDTPVLLDPGFFAKGLKRKEGDDGERDITHYGMVLRLEDYGLRAGSRRSAFVQTKNRNSNFRDSAAYQTYAEFGRRQLRAGHRVTIVVQTLADREISLALFEGLHEEFPDSGIRLEDPEDFSAFLECMRAPDVLVTSRFHAAILASAQGVPVVGIYSQTHGHKMPGLFDLLELGECSVRLDDRAAAQVVTEMVDACGVAVRQKAHTASRIDALKVRTLSWLEAALRKGFERPIDTSKTQIQALATINRVLAETMSKEHEGSIKASIKGIEKSLDELIDRQAASREETVEDDD